MNTAGDINPSSAWVNTTAGFNILKYTGSGTDNHTVGHNLGKKPMVWMVKCLDTARDWVVHTGDNVYEPGYDYFNLNTNGAKNNSSANAPTTSLFSVHGNDMNASGDEFIAYLWAMIPGYSYFAHWDGNSSTDGPFIHCGFKPKYIMWKPGSAGSDWVVYDDERTPTNLLSNYLLANSNNAEASAGTIDFLSNGFKLRTTTTHNNTSGTRVWFMAFAEHPFKYARSR